MVARRTKASREAEPLTMDREPDRYNSLGTPCWDLPDGRTVIGRGRRQIIYGPPTYVPVPREEEEQWTKEIVDLLTDILLDILRRRTAEEAPLPDPTPRVPRKPRGLWREGSGTPPTPSRRPLT